MVKQIFVNLAVKDLQASIDFYTRLGFTFNPQFTDDKATCMILGENIFVMLLVEDRFKDFTNKPISDAKKTTEALICVMLESREAVVAMVDNALKAGGANVKPAQDYGWMYGHSFADPDGHQWEPSYADMSKFPAQ